MRDLRAQRIVEISIADEQVLRFADTNERVDTIYVIAPSHEEVEKRIQDAYQHGESYYRVACDDDGKPPRVYFIVASNEFQARFIAVQLYKRVPSVRMQDAQPVIPQEVAR